MRFALSGTECLTDTALDSVDESVALIDVRWTPGCCRDACQHSLSNIVAKSVTLYAFGEILCQIAFKGGSAWDPVSLYTLHQSALMRRHHKPSGGTAIQLPLGPYPGMSCRYSQSV